MSSYLMNKVDTGSSGYLSCSTSFSEGSSDKCSRRKSFFASACFARQSSSKRTLSSASLRCSTPEGTKKTRILSSESGRSLQLSSEEKRVIHKTWRDIPDKVLWCQRMFMKLFSLRCPFKKVMGYENVCPKELLQCARFEAHCTRFVDFWEVLVEALNASCSSSESEINEGDECKNGYSKIKDPAEKLVSKIRDVGYLHCQMPGVTFDAESWLFFKNVLLESVCCQQCHSREMTYSAWSKFVTFVISEMKDAFHLGVRARSNTF